MEIICYTHTTKFTTVGVLMNIKFLLLFALLITNLQAAAPMELAMERLFTGINPMKRLPLKRLPKGFFVENRQGVTVERIDERTLFVHDNKKEERDTRRLFAGITPTRRLPFHKLPENFFVEDSKGVTVEHLDERMMFIHDDRQEEKEKHKVELFRRSGKKLALLGHGDRRVVIKNLLEPPYMAISYLRMVYNITPHDELVFSGTGFRNPFNQIVTAGHNVFVEKDFIKKTCQHKKITLQDYDFKKENLSIDVFFGFKEDSAGPSYTHTVLGISGICSFRHHSRDFGIVSLPVAKSSFLDRHVGALGVNYLPDQPHEYLGKEVSIVGYPGEKKPREMYSHSGPILRINHKGIVSYAVDTSKGNSGSPGFFNLKKTRKGNMSNFPACLVHTHSLGGQSNAGERMDPDLAKFMQDLYKGKF